MKLGYEIKTGEPVDIPVTHTVFSALTGGGKTEAILRSLEGAAAAGFTVLAIDVKKDRDFAGIGREVRPYISESTEPLLVLRMLESLIGAGLFSKFSVLLDACADAETLDEVHRNLEGIRDNKKKWPRGRDDAKVLAHLLGKLLEQIREGDYADEVRLDRGAVNVMNLSNLPVGVQQLIVDSVFRWLLKHAKKCVLVLEEAINFIPQAEKTTFDTTARKYIREGRSSELFLWVSGQALTEMEIAVRKQMRVWVLGPQMEEREAEKFRKQVPMKGVEAHEIQKLPTGHFIAAIRRSEEEGGAVDVKRVYAQPLWLPDDAAVKVAKGTFTLRDVMHFKKTRSKPKAVKDMDEEERKRWEEAVARKDTEIAGLKKSLEQAVEKNMSATVKIEELSRRTLDLERRLDAKMVEHGEISEAALGVREASREVSKDRSAGLSGFTEVDIAVIRGVARDEVGKELAKLGPGRVVEVPAKRVILSTFLEGHVQRIKEPLTKLPDRAKKYLAMLASKEGWQGTKSIAIALFGYGSDAAAVAKSLADVGAAEYDSQHGKVRYALLETLKKDLQGQYEISDDELADIHAALQHEFLGMIGGEPK